jgi:hypothetical protein
MSWSEQTFAQRSAALYRNGMPRPSLDACRDGGSAASASRRRPDPLESFRSGPVVLAFVGRPLFADLRADALARELPENVELDLGPAPFDPAPLTRALPEALRAPWLRELRALTDLFVRAAEPRAIHAFFGAVRDHRCPKFHVDAYRARLVCTFAGPTTEWIPGELVDWRAAGDGLYATVEAANRAISRDPANVRRATNGDALLLKGRTWPGIDGRGAMHRSPPLAPGESRLVLILTSERGEE